MKVTADQALEVHKGPMDKAGFSTERLKINEQRQWLLRKEVASITT